MANPETTKTEIPHINNVCFDAMSQIFSQLPLNANFSSSCVCKSWHDMLMEPEFTPKKPSFVSRYSAVGDLTYGLWVGNSCHGLVCLCAKKTGAPVGVWNPNHGEIVYRVPEVTSNVVSIRFKLGATGLGFRSKTNEYKVVWIEPDSWEVKILTLGDINWRRLGTLPFQLACSKYNLCCGTYFRGAIHWIVHGHDSELICLVEMETEKLHSLPPPPDFFSLSPRGSRYLWSNLGVLDDCLYICAADGSSVSPKTEVWIMADYGVKESWGKVFSIKNPLIAWWNPHRSIQLLKFDKDKGELRLLFANTAFFSYNSRNGELNYIDRYPSSKSHV